MIYISERCSDNQIIKLAIYSRAVRDCLGDLKPIDIRTTTRIRAVQSALDLIKEHRNSDSLYLVCAKIKVPVEKVIATGERIIEENNLPAASYLDRKTGKWVLRW